MGNVALAVNDPGIPAPPGWEWVPLRRVARMESGHTPSRKRPEYWGGAIPWIGIKDAKRAHGGTISETLEQTNALGINNSSARVLPAGTVCLSRTASVGYVVKMGRAMATSQDFANWVCSERLDPNFLRYLFIAEGSAFSRFSSGSIHQTIYYPELKAFHVCIPPLEEQKRIVAVLDQAFAALDRARAHAEANLAEATFLYERRREALLGGAGDGWKKTTVGNVCERFEYGTSAKSLPQGRVPVLRMGNLQGGEIDWTDLVYTNNSSDIGKLLLRLGDVLFNRTNSVEHVGKTAIYRGEREAIFAGYLIRLHLKSKLADPEFMNIFLNSNAAREYGRSVMGKSVNQANISASKLKDYPLPLPPVEEQRRIVQDLRVLRRRVCDLRCGYTEALADIADLRESLLQKAFSGQLT